MGISIAEAQAKFLSEGGPMGGSLRPAPNELSEMEKLLAGYIERFLNKGKYYAYGRKKEVCLL